MKTVGQLLKSAREKKEYSLADVEKATKIRIKHLDALEKDQYHQLPSGTYARGFIKNYADFLNLPEKTLLSIFRRDFTENEQGQIIPRSMVKPLANKRLLWTPKTTLITIIVILAMFFGGFIFFQYQSLINPKLEVFVPAEGEILLGPTVSINGKADPSSVVTVNGQLVEISANGSFSASLDLPIGKAIINFEATNNRGYTTNISRNVEVRIEK